MRILISSTHFSGHLQPLLPYARALQHRGHDVLVSAPEEAGSPLQKAGVVHAPVGSPSPEALEQVRLRLDQVKGEAVPAMVARDLFIGLFASHALPMLQATIRGWRPDLILRESFEYAAAVAAEAAGVPHARVSVHSSQYEAGLRNDVIEPLDAFRRAAGLRPDDGAALRTEPIFTAFPELLDGSADTTGWQVPFRSREPHKAAVRAATPPAWAPKDGEPLLYITFGTVSGRSEKARSLYRAALEAVSTLPLRALLTTGPVMDVAALGAIPPNVTVEAFVPQAEVFSLANAVVCHGGSGTLLGGLAAGLPMVVAPIFADQPLNARSVEAAGAGIAVFDLDAPSLRAAMERVLVDADLRSGARRIADEMAAMPTPDAAVDVLQPLALDRAD